MIQQKITIKKHETGNRIDFISAQRFPEISRSQWSKRGKFKKGNTEKPAKTIGKEGEIWTLEYQEQDQPSSLIPWDHSLTIIQESKTWVAVEKPIHIAVHPSMSDHSQQTIVNALIHQFQTLSESYDDIDGQKIPRPGLVHRLDKETSGILLVAKTTKTHKYLQDNWKEVEKIYTAIVIGTPPKKGKIEGGIARDPSDRQKMTVLKSENAKEAITYFERIKSHNNLSLLKIRIPTGRTHQIRVHMSSIGFSILGDEKYGGHKADRLMLHATSLTFPDPDKNGEMTTCSSKIPEEFLI
jgi:23S rRNA pseudouridine1911/1915/1917 synthase